MAATGGVRGAWASAYDAKPKLVVILVLDQFRGDYLDRYRADFKTADGFNLFLKKGAYFPECYYGYGNLMTAPGHSSIGTGAYSDGHNIALNDWWDTSRNETRTISSVEDPEYPLVGATVDAANGASPHNELASTLGDEVVLATGGRAQVYGVSLKDRAAILTSGHASRGAFWLDAPTGKWISSRYWYAALPEWVERFNNGPAIEAARKDAGVAGGSFYNTVGATPAGVRYELAFAKALVDATDLGKHDVTDVLTVSISSTDILGHAVGPDSPKQHEMIDATDVALDDFFRYLDAHVEGGLGQVWVALTGDHGVGASPAVAIGEGMPAGSFSYAGLVAELNRELNARYSPNAAKRFVLGGEMPYVQLDARVWGQYSVDEKEAEEMVAGLLPGAVEAIQQAAIHADPDSRALKPVIVRRSYTRVQMAAGQVPATEEGKLILHSYSTNGGWWVLWTPGMYQMPGYEQTGAGHYSPYSYDRHVPLGFFGGPFVPGTYFHHAEPVDIAATFAALLRINQPSASVGRVVVEALRKDGARAEESSAHKRH